MLSLGIDVGSSSVKVSVFDPDLGKTIGSGIHPEHEMSIVAHQSGWAEQEPDWWWESFLKAFQMATQNIDSRRIEHIGIAYQMHGLVCLDKNGQPLRPSIIWCDSRSVEIGNRALESLGAAYAFQHLLNSPGNFTASKLSWVKSHEPELFERIDKICLPGDYIGLKLCGTLTTTISGLSEGIFYDFKTQALSQSLLEHFGFDAGLFPDIKNTFDDHGQVSASMAQLLNISPRARLCYKAGDQPNNALSLNVLRPGEMAATAGTSGVVYGVSDQLFIDYSQRVNSFAHVNYTRESPAVGILLCINGVGIANAWLKKLSQASSYEAMNREAEAIRPGADGLLFLPFGNGAERMLCNANPGASLSGLHFNRHGMGHLCRAVQEGVAFSFLYGMAAFEENHIAPAIVRAGRANLFLSPVFAQIIASLFQVPLELYDTDGATGAARGALIGAGFFQLEEAFQQLEILETLEPSQQEHGEYQAHFDAWKAKLQTALQGKTT